MNRSHAHLLCYVLKRDSGSTALHGTAASAKGTNSGSTCPLRLEGAHAVHGRLCGRGARLREFTAAPFGATRRKAS